MPIGGAGSDTSCHDDKAPWEPPARPSGARARVRSAGEGHRTLSGQANGRPRVAVVLPGGGARGAFEAGVLSILLPALEARGEHVSIICGTSVGAINAALLGSVAALPAHDQATAILERWRSMRKQDVIAPLVGSGLPMQARRAVGEVLELPGLRLPGLMDARPLRASLERWIDWLALHRNVHARRLHAVCVVATSLDRSGPVAFVESRDAAPRAGSIRYVPVRLAGEHVRASAAIPFLFPPVRVRTPRRAGGDYIDGGTRMNAPLAPALALGADRVIVIGFEPLERAAEAPLPGRPHVADVAANVLDGLLVDQVTADVRRMLAINSFFAEGIESHVYRTTRGRTPYRRIAHAIVSPHERGAIGAIADEVLRERYGGWKALRSPDFLLLSRLLGGSRARSRGELLSFLLFDEAFVERLIAEGRQAARRWLATNPGFWRTQTETHPVAAEQHALAEFRAQRR